jgi:CBS-domain-containing membrane protein
MLLFGVTDSPLAQPRNLIFGHVISACVAVAMVALFGPSLLTSAVSVGLAIMFMNLTRTEHPPGGATALIGAQGSAGPHFIIVPVLAGALVLLTVDLFTNNIVYHRRYPQKWR